MFNMATNGVIEQRYSPLFRAIKNRPCKQTRLNLLKFKVVGDCSRLIGKFVNLLENGLRGCL